MSGIILFCRKCFPMDFKVSIFLTGLMALSYALPENSLANKIQIQLKNGKAYKVSHYWEQGGNIFFQYLGGKVGFRKKDIKSIRQVFAVEKLNQLESIRSKNDFNNAQKDMAEKNKINYSFDDNYEWEVEKVCLVKAKDGQYKVTVKGILSVKNQNRKVRSIILSYKNENGLVVKEKSISTRKFEQLKPSKGKNNFRVTDTVILNRMCHAIEVSVNNLTRLN